MKRGLKELDWTQAWHHQSWDLLGMSPLEMLILGSIILILTIASLNFAFEKMIHKVHRKDLTE